MTTWRIDCWLCWFLSPLCCCCRIWRWLRVVRLLQGPAMAISTHYCFFQAIRFREQCALKMMCAGTRSWNCLFPYLMGLFILNVPGRPVSWPVLWTLPSEFTKFWYIGGFQSKHNSFISLLGFALSEGIEGWVGRSCVFVYFIFLSIYFFMSLCQLLSALKCPPWVLWELSVTVCMTLIGILCEFKMNHNNISGFVLGFVFFWF